jgi:hypothetical protein
MERMVDWHMVFNLSKQKRKRMSTLSAGLTGPFVYSRGDPCGRPRGGVMTIAVALGEEWWHS